MKRIVVASALALAPSAALVQTDRQSETSARGGSV